ncbi:olfactory receptor 2M2-like, partial [Pelobates cultripes]
TDHPATGTPTPTDVNYIRKMNSEVPQNVSGFLIYGLTDIPELQVPVFITFLVVYFIIVFNNTSLFLAVLVDPHLHTPMYIFLTHLSLIDVTYTSNVLPKLLNIILTQCKNISFAGCITQMYIFASLTCTEFLLLSAMAYDRYAAICSPLYYFILMSMKRCAVLISTAWFIGFLNPTGHAVLISAISFCSSRLIDHFFCDVIPLLKLSCTDTSIVEMLSYIEGVLLVFPAFLLTVISYICIIAAILKIKSAEGRHKAFSTCTSHLTCVIIFYLTVMSVYMRPTSSASLKKDKFFSLLYIVLVPMLNPIIYSLKNQEVKNALKKLKNTKFVKEITILVIMTSRNQTPELQFPIFMLFLFIYLIIICVNGIIFVLILCDTNFHTPMHTFLMMLSLIDLSSISNIKPNMLYMLHTQHKTISFLGCVNQTYLCLSLTCTDTLLLGAMAYDRYVAICHPLHYFTLMSTERCGLLISMAWTIGFTDPLAHFFFSYRSCLTASKYIDHFFCDVIPLLKISCSDTSIIEMLTYVIRTVLIVPDFLLILISYILIISTILKIKSADGRRKAFSTCTSHLTCVIIFYGTISCLYMRPTSSYSPKQDKFVALLFVILVPMMNPLIYSLKNQEVKTALKKVKNMLEMSLPGNSISNIKPNMLYMLHTQHKTISFLGCVNQTYLFLSLTCTDTLLLGAMAYDRYVAICHPLHYFTLMSTERCGLLKSMAWTIGFTDPLAHFFFISKLSPA